MPKVAGFRKKPISPWDSSAEERDCHAPVPDDVTAAAKEFGAFSGLVCGMVDPAQISAMFDKIEAEHGPVSPLVNNAGVAIAGDVLN